MPLYINAFVFLVLILPSFASTLRGRIPIEVDDVFYAPDDYSEEFMSYLKPADDDYTEEFMPYLNLEDDVGPLVIERLVDGIKNKLNKRYLKINMSSMETSNGNWYQLN